MFILTTDVQDLQSFGIIPKLLYGIGDYPMLLVLVKRQLQALLQRFYHWLPNLFTSPNYIGFHERRLTSSTQKKKPDKVGIGKLKIQGALSVFHYVTCHLIEVR